MLGNRKLLWPGQARRGSMYVWVVSTSLMVSVIGIGSMSVVRLQRERADLEQNWSEAGLLAASGVEHACATLAYDRWWRDKYDAAEGSYGNEVPFGNGYWSWQLQDPVDSDLNDATGDPVRILGRGRVGNSVQACSVLAWPGSTPLDALRTVIHARGTITNSYVLDARGGPVSCNGTLRVWDGTVIGAAEADYVDAPWNVTGGATAPVPAKALPPKTVWEVYRSLATEIPFESLANGSMANVLLTPQHNSLVPGATNPDGVYLISVPAYATLTIRNCRLEATLLVRLRDAGARLVMDTGVVWQPGRADFPALLAYFRSESSTSASLVCRGQLVESSCNVNFNPEAAPYFGNSDSDKTDTYTASLRGLFHLLRPYANYYSNETTLHFTEKLKGCVLADGNVRIVGDSVIMAEPRLVSTPPLCYTVPATSSNLATNGGLESGLAGWSAVGSGAWLEWSTYEHSGSYSVRVRGRASAADGIRQDLSHVVQSGHDLDIELWLRMYDNRENALVSLEVNSANEGTRWFTATAPNINTSWTRGRVQLTPTWTGDLNYANLVVTTTTSTQRFQMDDVEVVDTIALRDRPPELTPIVSTWQAEAAQ